MADQQQLRKSYITIPLSLAAVAAGVATFIATHAMRVISAQLTLSNVGTGAGATTVIAKLNGNAIATSAALTLTVAGGVKAVKATVPGTTTAQSYPGGLRVNAGDTITVDVTALPATTSPAIASVILSVTQLDI
jgi:hypothetical protein